MNITTYTGLVGFLLALATLNTSLAQAAPPSSTSSIAARLDRLTAVIKEREAASGLDRPELEQRLAGFANGSGGRGAVTGPAGRGWADGNNGRGWGNAGVGGWGNGASGGGFVNVNPWRNTWVNGGGFYNYSPGWVNGGAAWRNGGGAGWVNR
uniref:RSAM-associated Gly-rich repeat protein n=1 Tax=Cyanothece sp. (strain PCC 7425 / ATCC 29141) TaxID=395961 RepID=B8HSH8_CYAP4